MARIRTRWHKSSKPKDPETVAGAMGMNIWKMASGTANKMYSEGFNFKSNSQLLDIIGEFSIFLLQLCDRIAYEDLDETQRQRFTQALAGHLINTMVENQVEELKGEAAGYQQAFIEKLNHHLEGYSEFAVSNGEPSYQMLRYFGTLCDEVMGGSDNKWVIEHVMEVEAPPFIRQVRESMEKLLPQMMPADDNAETAGQE
ncbi:MAG: hypothetical protein OQK96_06140 [Gammaproteobacteria bacterium]|nr:hypothetical protein [Gammaproteobacteria bacterium]MCW8958037.1 hypothetical protein [Gammaproteobacteria bacterium]MCW8991799.1 hypothetical protein [Gammaproteobacteria bacterium]